MLLVLVFLVTFVVPVARGKQNESEGFQNMKAYEAERNRMLNYGKRQYNNLGDQFNPILPTFAVAPIGIDKNESLSHNQYMTMFNTATDKANKNIVQALANPDIMPIQTNPTNMGPHPYKVDQQIPAANDLVLTARKCENKLKGRDACSLLNNQEFSQCGVCIDAGTKFDGSNPDKFIGGLLSLKQDRVDAIDAAAGGTPMYAPSLGKCPPGMFYIEKNACIKAANQLNCKEIGESGGFQGGRTHENRQIPSVSCAQAPVAGTDVYLYQPPNKPYDVTLRFLTPNGTGITKIVATHVRSKRTFAVDNGGRAGVEFTLTIRGVIEQDEIAIKVSQEVPHRPKGQPEVFYVMDNNSSKYTQKSASDLCTRIGTTLASSAQVTAGFNNGLQSGRCAMVSDNPTPMYSVQSGTRDFVGLGSRPSTNFCNTRNNDGAWCYGFKPIKSVQNTSIPTQIMDFFASFANKAQPAQGQSKYSQFTTPDSIQPPGISERAILIQWEMKDANNRTVPFQQTVTSVNGYPAVSVLRMLGPFSKSSLIAGPAWASNFTMQKNQFWFWSNSAASQSATFTAKVPGYLQSPYYTDDLQKAPMGPLITNPKTMDLLKTSPCFAEDQKAGSYSTACLLTLFQGAGGDPAKGTLATQNGGLAQLNGMGDLSNISDYLDDLYLTATTGRDGNGNVVSMDMPTRLAAMNDAAMKMFGFKITSPCENVVDQADGSVGIVPKVMGEVTADCLQYLWLNNLSDQDRSTGAAPPNSLYSNTYTSVADRFSGLRYNESSPRRRAEFPFAACQTTGTMSPIKNNVPDTAVIAQLTSMPSLQAVQDYFNNIQKTANYTHGQQDAAIQEKAMQQCYGINRKANDAKGFGCVDFPTMPGKLLWLDGKDKDSMILSGSAISVWKDKSGNNFHASAARGNPQYISSGGGVRFPGGPFFTLNARYSQATTVFMVASGENTVSNWGGSYYWNFDKTNMSGTMINNNSNIPLSPLCYYDNVNGVSGYFVKGNTLASPFLASVIQNPGSTITGYYNGNQVFSKPYSPGNATAITLIGAALPAGDSPLNGNIYELIFFNRPLTFVEHDQVSKYLIQKWNLPSA